MRQQLKLNEEFVLPIGLKPVIKLYNMTLYSSDSLKEKYIRIISNQSLSKKFAPKIVELVNNGSVIPCFLDKNLIKHSVFKILGKDIQKKSTVAFYAVDQDKVIISISNHVKYLAFSNDGLLAQSTLHELMHMAAKRSPSQFLSTFKVPLNEFYSNYLKSLFQMDIKPDVTKFVSFLFKLESTSSKSGIKLMDIYSNLQKFRPQSTLSDELFDQYCRDYLLNIKLSFLDFNTWMKNKWRYAHIINNLYKSYIETFGKLFEKNYSIVIQELYTPSEVIAVMSEMKGNYSNLINQGVNLC